MWLCQEEGNFNEQPRVLDRFFIPDNSHSLLLRRSADDDCNGHKHGISITGAISGKLRKGNGHKQFKTFDISYDPPCTFYLSSFHSFNLLSNSLHH